jgi:hypothetical protein
MQDSVDQLTTQVQALAAASPGYTDYVPLKAQSDDAGYTDTASNLPNALQAACANIALRAADAYQKGGDAGIGDSLTQLTDRLGYKTQGSAEAQGPATPSSEGKK